VRRRAVGLARMGPTSTTARAFYSWWGAYGVSGCRAFPIAYLEQPSCQRDLTKPRSGS
jgi:hypothetical protein